MFGSLGAHATDSDGTREALAFFVAAAFLK